jgi:hypothetical protein
MRCRYSRGHSHGDEHLSCGASNHGGNESSNDVSAKRKKAQQTRIKVAAKQQQTGSKPAVEHVVATRREPL